MTGTIFTVNAWRNDALEVPLPYQQHRFWRNTPMVASQAAERGAKNNTFAPFIYKCEHFTKTGSGQT
jgi:hypothetical protein